ncbi:hypothetical protein [Streptomyces sp. A5-4]|uniref:hypothetical protein n=1 Tax=Streptomyces sp. A5-4 TaxID=3384771 RepID=UPI003DA99B51
MGRESEPGTAKGKERSRPPGGPRERDKGAPTFRGAPHPRNAVRAPPEPPDELPDLLATLGEYLRDHPPEDVAILLRAELEQREFRAYANGWQDAADEYEPALEQARRATQARRLRLVGHTPGQAALIPFPQDPPGRQDPTPVRKDDDVTADTEPVAEAAHVEADRKTPTPEATPTEHRPGLVVKNGNSRVPTIPRLPAHRPVRRDRPRTCRGARPWPGRATARDPTANTP